MSEQQSEPMRFKAWANDKGYDTAHTYDTERSRWVFFNPMTAELWESWRAALSKPSTEQGWRTIESAPRDGTMFLCWVRAERYGETDEGQQYQHDESQVDFCWWRTLAESPDGGYFDPTCGQIGDRQFVSHWMPLPPPPIEPREEKL